MLLAVLTDFFQRDTPLLQCFRRFIGLHRNHHRFNRLTDFITTACRCTNASFNECVEEVEGDASLCRSSTSVLDSFADVLCRCSTVMCCACPDVKDVLRVTHKFRRIVRLQVPLGHRCLQTFDGVQHRECIGNRHLRCLRRENLRVLYAVLALTIHTTNASRSVHDFVGSDTVLRCNTDEVRHGLVHTLLFLSKLRRSSFVRVGFHLRDDLTNRSHLLIELCNLRKDTSGNRERCTNQHARANP